MALKARSLFHGGSLVGTANRLLLGGLSFFLLQSCGGLPEGPPAGSSSSSSSSGGGSSAPLNDTGILKCQSLLGFVDCRQTPGQDGNTGRDALAAEGRLSKKGGGAAGFDFTKLGADGKPLAIQQVDWQMGGKEADGSHWRCVKDNHTGLIWEVKQDDPAELGYGQYSYSWYNPNPLLNGGFAGNRSTELCGGIACDTEAFTAAMNQQKLCGFTHWRLPKVAELMSLVWGDRQSLAIDNAYFPNTPNSHFWTSQSFAPLDTSAWYVYFSDGSPSNTLKATPMHIRLVHDSEFNKSALAVKPMSITEERP